MRTKEAEIAESVGAILHEADLDIAARRPVCRASGRCCKFEEYGHRLYVTAAEVVHFEQARRDSEETDEVQLATIARAAAGRISLPQFFASEAPRGCPYQVDGLCTAREARPLGCRVYFCDENAQSWQSEVYEKYHKQLAAVHERFGLAYRYIEWRAALREMV